MQNRRVRQIRFGIESLEGRQLTTSMVIGSMSLPAAAHVQPTAGQHQNTSNTAATNGRAMRIILEDTLISTYSSGSSS